MRTVIDSKKPAWITLAVALVLNTLLLSAQTSKHFDTSFVRVWLLASLGPFEKLVDAGVEGVENIWTGYIGLVHVRSDNDKLLAENSKLRMEVSEKSEDALELARLRKLLALQAKPIGKTVAARVIGKDPSQIGQSITIDKGSRNGIGRDATIITGDGVVGRVVRSSDFFSVVQLIIDSQSAVGFIVRSSRRVGILKGTGGAELEMAFIDDDNDIVQGDELITSGQDQIYPKGIPLGTVLSVGPREGNFKVVRIRPSVNFGHLEEVLVMTDHLPEVDMPTGQVP
jgi:rod shape-determining protein MreC